MKPSESIFPLYNKEKLIEIDNSGVNLIILHSKSELSRTRLILNLISQLIDERKKSMLWISRFESLKMEDMFLMLMSIRLNCSIRDIKNQTFLKKKSELFLKEKELVDSLVSFESYNEGADLEKVTSRDSSYYHFFVSITSKMTVLERQITMRELNKFSRVFSRGRCIISSSLDSEGKILLESLYSSNTTNFKIEEDNINKSLYIYKISQSVPYYEDDTRKIHHLDLLLNNYKILYSENERYLDQNTNSHKNDYKIKVDPKTQLFCKLSNKNVLDLKDLGLKIAKTEKINLNNEYVRLWINSCGIDDVEKLKTILPIKIYISIANRLDLAVERDSTTL